MSKSILISMNKSRPWEVKKYNKSAPYAKDSIPQTKSFLIICEGKNTEPQYFESFPIASAEVKTIGLGASKTYLVNYAIDQARKKENKDREIWCVFDYDIKRDQEGALRQDFHQAIYLASKYRLKVAYSNDSFELWFILHYQYLDTRLTRHQYYPRLQEIWKINNYETECKSIKFSRNIYKMLEADPRANQANAIRNAKRLMQEHIDKDYCERVPCTTVFELVEELNKYVKK